MSFEYNGPLNNVYPYKADEMPKELLFLSAGLLKLVSLYVVCFNVVEPFDDVK